MLSDLRNNIKLYNDVLSTNSTNRCRLEHIIYPPGVNEWNSNDNIHYYTFPCNVCPLKCGNVCVMSRYNLKVK